MTKAVVVAVVWSVVVDVVVTVVVTEIKTGDGSTTTVVASTVVTVSVAVM